MFEELNSIKGHEWQQKKKKITRTNTRKCTVRRLKLQIAPYSERHTLIRRKTYANKKRVKKCPFFKLNIAYGCGTDAESGTHENL